MKALTSPFIIQAILYSKFSRQLRVCREAIPSRLIKLQYQIGEGALGSLSQAAVGCEQRSASSLSLCQYGTEPQSHQPTSLHHQQLQPGWRSHRHHPSLPASPVHDRSPTHITSGEFACSAKFCKIVSDTEATRQADVDS
ncbi:hypothetical protein AAG570_003494 [Ranatra chinensis]|uniref:Uncharacterized protein n=1 Tax=Ranatra chinensis TaxID=642074 RepID=A0ABD0Y3W1_9HEMI